MAGILSRGYIWYLGICQLGAGEPPSDISFAPSAVDHPLPGKSSARHPCRSMPHPHIIFVTFKEFEDIKMCEVRISAGLYSDLSVISIADSFHLKAVAFHILLHQLFSMLSCFDILF
jgi:hypothetical protein